MFNCALRFCKALERLVRAIWPLAPPEDPSTGVNAFKRFMATRQVVLFFSEAPCVSLILAGCYFSPPCVTAISGAFFFLARPGFFRPLLL